MPDLLNKCRMMIIKMRTLVLLWPYSKGETIIYSSREGDVVSDAKVQGIPMQM